MSRRIYFIMALMCLAALSLAACGGASQPTSAAPTASSAPAQPATVEPTTAPPPAPTATTPPTAEPTAAATQPAALSGTTIDMNNPIFKAYFAVYNKFPRRARSEVFNPQTKQTTTVVIETDAKDRVSFEIGGVGGTSGMTMSMVIISPTMYLKQGATWQKLPGAQSGTMLGMLTNADSLQQSLNALGELTGYTVTPVGPEDVNGVPAMAYSTEITLKDGTTSKGKAWVGADGLLIRDSIETSQGTVVTTTYEFDPSIKVEAPIP